MTTREISDNKNSMSSTRWAFATVIKFDCVVIALVLLSGLISHFVPFVEDIDSSFYGAVTVLLGILTSLVTASKALQGFESHKASPHSSFPTNSVEKDKTANIEAEV